MCFDPLLRCFAVAVNAAGMLLADFSYEQTSTVTGGMLASVIKMAGAFPKPAREPKENNHPHRLPEEDLVRHDLRGNGPSPG